MTEPLGIVAVGVEKRFRVLKSFPIAPISCFVWFAMLKISVANNCGRHLDRLPLWLLFSFLAAPDSCSTYKIDKTIRNETWINTYLELHSKTQLRLQQTLQIGYFVFKLTILLFARPNMANITQHDDPERVKFNSRASRRNQLVASSQMWRCPRGESS